MLLSVSIIRWFDADATIGWRHAALERTVVGVESAWLRRHHRPYTRRSARPGSASLI
jgi:hypothetical protein